MPKQDRQGARTPADLERRYNYSKSLKEVKSAAAVAQQVANKSSQAVTTLDQKLDQVDIINRLTRNGTAQGIYIDSAGEIYISANYVMDGAIKLYDYIDSKIAYVAMTAGTLLVGQVTKAKIETWYDVALWTADMVNAAVTKGVITSAEAAEILG